MIIAIPRPADAAMAVRTSIPLVSSAPGRSTAHPSATRVTAIAVRAAARRSRWRLVSTALEIPITLSGPIPIARIRSASAPFFQMPSGEASRSTCIESADTVPQMSPVNTNDSRTPARVKSRTASVSLSAWARASIGNRMNVMDIRIWNGKNA